MDNAAQKEVIVALAHVEATYRDYSNRRSALIQELADSIPHSQQSDFNVPHVFEEPVGNQVVRITVTRPLKEEWSQAKLRMAQVDLDVNDVDYGDALTTEIKVSKRGLKKLNPEHQATIMEACTTTPYKQDGELLAPRVSIDFVE